MRGVKDIPELDNQAAQLTARGTARRQNLIDAALRLVVRDGHHAVTLRAVSQEAKASLGSVNYYFGTRSALMCAAAEHVCHRIATNLQELAPEMEAAAHEPERFINALVQHNIKYMFNDRGMSLAIYELTLAGARDRELRSVLMKWGKIHSRLTRQAFLELGSADPDLDYAFILNSLGGLIVAQLAFPRRDFEARVLRPSLRRMVLSIVAESKTP